MRRRRPAAAGGAALAALWLLAAACSGGEGRSDAPDGPVVRMHLATLAGKESVRIEAGAFRVLDPETGRETARGEALQRDLPLRGTTAFDLVPADDGVRVDGALRPGRLLVRPGRDGARLVVETRLERYLPGVLAAELGEGAPPAALRAQAIAARTYALSRIREAPDAPWHVTDDVRTQAWRAPRNQAPAAAVADTRGVVLRFEDRLVPTWYHSTCGGRTAAARDALGGPDLPPLSGVECPFCVESPHRSWRVRIPLPEVVSALDLPATPTAAEILTRSPEGRAAVLRFDAGGPVDRPAGAARLKLGAARLKSTALSALRVEGDVLVAEGVGFGHGAGLCQWGALTLARAGLSPADVLAHYYPGASPTRIY